MDFTSTGLIRVLESISDGFTNTLFSALIGNIVTSIAKNKTSPLQLALGFIFGHSKKTVSHL